MFQMSDAQLDSMVQAHYDKLYRDAFERPEPHCENCIHYIKSSHQCERENEDEDEYVYAYVNPDDDVCDDFEADEYQQEVDY